MNKYFNLKQKIGSILKRSTALLSILFIIPSAVVLAGIREPAVAGQFYPGDSSELASYVDAVIAKVPRAGFETEPIAFLVPHAGYPYSGEIAARVYKVVAEIKPQIIIFVGTAHRYPLRGASIYPKGSFKTPLGEVKIDSETAKKLIDRDRSLIDVAELAHEKEHSIETQLPFLQRVLPEVSIVPVIIGGATFDVAVQLGSAIAEVARENNELKKKTIVIASTDLSHYPNKENAKRSDLQILESLKAVHPNQFWIANQKLLASGIPNLECVMCGDLAMAAVLQAAEELGANEATILKYANSADVSFGDPNRVVGYAAAAFFKRKEIAFDFTKSDLERLTEVEKRDLLKIARITLEDFAGVSATPRSLQVKDSQNLAAVFVTLKKNGQLHQTDRSGTASAKPATPSSSELRGCIGSPEANLRIAEAIQKYTIAAASQDPRFSPVTRSDVGSIDIEISILSPQKKIKSADEIEPGKHGVVLESGTHRGLLLPQVWEMIPDKTQFLNTLALEKAGVAEDAWKKPETSLHVFESKNFSEKEYAK